jgi:aminopeptidase S
MRRAIAASVVSALAVLGLALPSAAADPPSRSAPVPAAELAADLPNGAPDIDTNAVLAHLDTFQSIATTEGNGNRCTGSGGYTGSVRHVKESAEKAGYTVTEQPFDTFGGAQSSNVLAELPGQDPGTVLMLGGHLDSVCAGPGINDNGSGSAALLAVAEAFAEANPNPPVTVRFGWWGHEEAGLVGSQYYTENLSGDERARIQAYLNFDMVGSPNAGYFVYNDDDPAIEQTIKDYFVETGVPTEGQSVGGRSDSASFQQIGISTGGIFSGAEQRKTQAQADKWGGQAGVAFDPCYHRSCDTTSNIDETALGRNSDAVSWALWELAGGGAADARTARAPHDVPGAVS